ncbi:MAG: glycosyltransferase family 2 protein, partial [Oscillochloris sp.]|nr:glycosyltransferase family 2 protein [Oscillochloris sp.]
DQSNTHESPGPPRSRQHDGWVHSPDRARRNMRGIVAYASIQPIARRRRVNGACGRGPQLNAGAAVATGDVLIFLHADTSLPPNAFSLLQTYFSNPQVQAAKFRLSFDLRHPVLDLAARMMWFDSVWTSFGDQCIVLRRGFFASVGGFPPWPLFEDVRMFELARAQTPIYVIPAEVVTSARRFVEHGIVSQLLRDVWFMLQYLFGVPPEVIAGIYEQRGAATRAMPVSLG